MTRKNDTEELVEHALDDVRNLLARPHALEIVELHAVAEQLRVEAMLARGARHRRRIYKALADFYDHVAADRRAGGAADPERGIGGAVRAIIENFEDDDGNPKDRE